MWAAEVETGFRAKVGAPVTFNAELVGEIDIKSLRPNAFTAQDVRRLEAVAGLVAGAVANARLHAAITRGAEEEKTLSEISRLASSSLEFDTAFNDFAASVGKLIPFDRFVVMGLDPDARLLWTHFVAGREVPGWEAGTSHVISDWQRGDQLMPPGGMLIESDEYAGSNEDAMVAAGFASCAAVPMIWEERAVGALSVRSEQRGYFTQHHLELLGRVAQQITGAFVNTELHAVTQ
jgi:GAF domain-containing protein